MDKDFMNSDRRASYDVDESSPNQHASHNPSANSGIDPVTHDEKTNGFNFGTMEERMFIPKGTSAAVDPFQQTAKQMFQSVEINIFVPKDPRIITEDFKVQDAIEDDPDQLIKLQYHCEVMSHTQVSAIIMKSLDYFNTQMHADGIGIRFNLSDSSVYQMRIAKKKNGRPNLDYPRIDPQQQVVNIDFTQFCIVYGGNAVQNIQSLSIQSSKAKQTNQKSTAEEALNQRRNMSMEQNLLSGNLPQKLNNGSSVSTYQSSSEYKTSTTSPKGGIPLTTTMGNEDDLQTNRSGLQANDRAQLLNTHHQSQAGCGGCIIF